MSTSLLNHGMQTNTAQSYNRAPTPSDDEIVQANQKPRSRKGKNFGGMRRSNPDNRLGQNAQPLSPQTSVLQPLAMKMTQNTLQSPHAKQGKPAPLAPADTATSARRSKFETARLKDANITLNNEILSRQAEVQAHIRFQSRSTDTANTLEEKLKAKDEQIRQLERAKEGLQKTLEDEREQVYEQLAASQKLVKQQEEREVQMDFRIRTAKKAHLEELVLLRRQLHQSQGALERSRQEQEQQQSNQSASRPTTAQEQPQPQLQSQGSSSSGPQKIQVLQVRDKGSKTTDEVKRAVAELQQKVQCMKRELEVKDRQLKSLRDELEEQDAAARESGTSGGGDDYTEVLEEELSMMRASYTRKLKEAEERCEKLQQQQMREQNAWERQKRDHKDELNGLKIEIDRKTKQLAAKS